MELMILVCILCMYASFGGSSPSTTKIWSNVTSSDQDDATTADPLAQDVDWISALGGAVIVIGMAMCYAIYVILRRRKELKQQAQEQQHALIMTARETNISMQGQQAQLEDFR
mmetsp:Transcript_25391/g.40392  ORF Transcript_25391/g.40392 Transcript_25391/m.40392 type:complete len:113 (+) Transcript_25391:90-428(+)|eukprot:CAMPEP_0197074224 /NCGR_PEP_ID=MMETSP1384-20130603/211001_1 /TAXON_ID=29189 /ORGANISM="Ammonia sp." /LENGTH=112 /DNA_ID=CAMNT_0042513065 /DNA_START=67 /DNA_END=405 /DNA_ORIENTATION=-